LSISPETISSKNADFRWLLEFANKHVRIFPLSGAGMLDILCLDNRAGMIKYAHVFFVA